MAWMGKVIKCNRKAAEIIQPIMHSQNHATRYLWSQGHTHTCTLTHTCTCPHESDFKKLGTRQKIHCTVEWFLHCKRYRSEFQKQVYLNFKESRECDDLVF